MNKPFILAVAASLGVAAGNAPAAAKVDFGKQIQPIFEQACVKCHGSDKHKGDLRLDLKDAAFKGGKDGPVIVAGDASKSDLYRRIILPEGSDDVMPNKGDVLTKAQTDLIRDWINQGALWPDDALAKAASSEPSALAVAKLGDIKPTAAELQATTKLQAMGVDVRPLAANLNWHEASFRSCDPKSTDAALAQLKDMLSLMELNLAGVKFSETSLASVKGLSNLTQLHLEHTSVTDAGLANVEGMSHLVYLNLFDTAVSDAGLDHLKSLGELRHLYLWQTKVTDTGVEALQKALPHCEIVRGWEASPVVAEAKDGKDGKDGKDAKN
jgi:mono/diheme cytochrome c family protein